MWKASVSCWNRLQMSVHSICYFRERELFWVGVGSMYCKMSHIFISLLLQFVRSVLAGKATAQAKVLTVAEFFSGCFFSSTIFKYLQICSSFVVLFFFFLLEFKNCSPVNIVLALLVTGHRLFVKLTTETLGLVRTSLDLFWPAWRIVLACNCLSNNWVIIFLICFKFGLAQHNCVLILTIVYIFMTDRQQ